MRGVMSRRQLFSESESNRRARQHALMLAAIPPAEINPSYLYDRQETALILSVSVPTVQRMERSGILPNPVRPSGSPIGKVCHAGRDIIAVRDGTASAAER